MAKLATCPSCTTQLALPEQATLSDRARCPRCQDEFLLMETVQFSIPEAEILAPREDEAVTTSATVANDEDSPALFMQEELSDDSSETIETPSIELPTSEPLSPSATLSDWEARLKRAIAENIDDDPHPTETKRPSFDFGKPKLESANAESFTESEEYDVADEDLFPKTESRRPAAESVVWSPEEAYAPEESTVEEPEYSPTIEQIAADIRSDQQAPFDVQTSSKPRTKRQRSVVRTLASASLGVVGIPLGLYALLWLRGPAGDMLHVAQYIPSFMLPASFEEPNFSASEELIAEQPLPSTSEETPPADEELIAETDEVETEPETDALAAEPLVREDAAVAPASAEVPAYRGPSLPLVSPREFSELFTTAVDVANQLGEGDLSTRESIASKGQAYMSLARLAEKSSYMNQPGLSPDEMTKALSAKRLFANLLADPVVQRDLPQIALRWWQYADRPSPGMIFTGKVERIEETPVGPLAFVTLGNASDVPAVPVLIGNANHTVGDEIGIVGKILPKPQETLRDIDPSLEAVVIDFYSLPVAAAN